MPDKVKFFMSFRVRLMLLLTGFLLLTMILVLALDQWAQRRAAEEVFRQSEQVKEAVLQVRVGPCEIDILDGNILARGRSQ